MMKTRIREQCEYAWTNIQEEENGFLNQSTKDPEDPKLTAIHLRGHWEDWLAKWADIGGYRGMATRRIELYNNVISDSITPEAARHQIKQDRKDLYLDKLILNF